MRESKYPDRSGLERELFAFTTSKPLMEEGDLRSVYSSKTQTLPEILDANSFNVQPNQKAQALKDDMELRAGTSIILSRMGDLSNLYLVVDIGHAHLPGVAEMLMSYGIDCSFVIPEEINERFHETLKYWAREFKTKKDDLSPQGYATLVDTHREYDIEERYFPTPEQLRRLGINRIIYLAEAPVGEFPNTPTIRDLESVFQAYRTAGFKIKAYGIDKRQGFRNFVK